jgi:ABC-type sugar transport system permease subunit
MWEILKVVWDIFVLRDAARKGKLNWRKTGFVVGFVVLEYLIAMPALLLYIQHPQYKPLFIAAMVLAVVILVVFAGLAWRLRSRPSTA